MSTIQSLPHKRKPLTYGKRSWSTAQDAFASFDHASSDSSPRRLPKPTQSPARKVLRRDAPADSDPFDVPSSGDEMSVKSASPAASRNTLAPNQRLRSPFAAISSLSKTASNPFDVPSSGDEHTITPKPARRAASRITAAKGRTSQYKKSQLSKPRQEAMEHRKRHTGLEGSVDGEEESDTSKQIASQFQRDMGMIGRTLDAENQHARSVHKTREDSDTVSARNRGPTAQKLKGVRKRNTAIASRVLNKTIDKNEPATSEPMQLDEVMLDAPLTPPRPQDVDGLHASETDRGWVSRSTTPGSMNRKQNTPKQAKLWDHLLDSNEAPNGTPNKDFGFLAITSVKKVSADNLSKSPTRGRPKLVDILKAPEDQTTLTDSHTATLNGSVPEEHREREIFDHGRPERRASVQTSSAPSSQPIEGGPRITYAKQRSYLNESSLGVDAMLLQPLDDFMSPAAGTAKQKGNRSSQLVPSSEDEEDGKGIRNLHELRAAKDTRRVAFELDAIMIDLDSGSSRSTKRGALLDLCNKLLDEPFRKQVVEHGYIYQIFKRCCEESDIILATTVTACAALVLGDKTQHQTALQLYEAGVIESFALALEVKTSITAVSKERKTNMSKIAQKSVSEFASSIQTSSIWKEERPRVTSPQILALRGLELLTRKLREAGNQDNLLQFRMLATLVALFRNLCNDMLAMDQVSGSMAKAKFDMVLSILESATIAPLCTSDVSLWNEKNMQVVAETLSTLLEARQDLPVGLHMLGLRTCLNLTNNNERNSQFFAQQKFVKLLLCNVSAGFESLHETTAEENSASFDALILSLGTMINLAEWSEDVRLTTALDARDELFRLLQHFLTGREKAAEADSMEASRANIPFGYLAILLGNLCQNDEARSCIQANLPNRRLDALVEAVDEFILYNKLADDNETFAAFSSRLQAVSESLKSFMQ